MRKCLSGNIKEVKIKASGSVGVVLLQEVCGVTETGSEVYFQYLFNVNNTQVWIHSQGAKGPRVALGAAG